MRRVMITGAAGNASMNFTESLEDCWTLGIDVNYWQLQAIESRYCRTIVAPGLDNPKWADLILQLVKDWDIEFINFQTDRELLVASGHEGLRALTLLPSHDTVIRCQNKLKTATWLGNLAADSGPCQESEFDRLFYGSGCVWMRTRCGAGSRGALPVYDWNMAEAWQRYWKHRSGLEMSDFMLCEYLPGPEFAFQSVWHMGQLVTSFARERKEYMLGGIMPSGQSSSPSHAVSVHNEEVNRIAVTAIRQIHPWATGVFCVDLKTDRNARVRVTEINAGRFFTTSNFATHGGMNMVRVWLDCFFGNDVSGYSKCNAVPAGLHWLRGVDRIPKMIRETL